MRLGFFVLLLTLDLGVGACAAQQPSPAPQQLPAAAAPAPPTEKVQPPATSPSPSTPEAMEAGYMEPAQVEALLHRVWLSEFRVHDLLTEVHPDRWRLSDTARDSFSKTLETLRVELGALEGWRDQFDKRTDSMYLAYETYAAIDAVLPRLDGVARSVSEHENASLGAQYTQAEDQLFDLEQALRPHLGYLLRNQDQILLATQNNLAACQNQLGFAMRDRAEPAKPIQNTMTSRPTKRRKSTGTPGNKQTKSPEK